LLSDSLVAARGRPLAAVRSATTVRRNVPPVAQGTALPVAGRRDRAALQAVNFFMADVQAGIGPFLGVLLQSRGWATGAIGTVTAIGGIAGLVATAPAGALIDATTRRRACVVVGPLGRKRLLTPWSKGLGAYRLTDALRTLVRPRVTSNRVIHGPAGPPASVVRRAPTRRACPSVANHLACSA